MLQMYLPRSRFCPTFLLAIPQLSTSTTLFNRKLLSRRTDNIDFCSVQNTGTQDTIFQLLPATSQKHLIYLALLWTGISLTCTCDGDECRQNTGLTMTPACSTLTYASFQFCCFYSLTRVSKILQTSAEKHTDIPEVMFSSVQQLVQHDTTTQHFLLHVI